MHKYISIRKKKQKRKQKPTEIMKQVEQQIKMRLQFLEAQEEIDEKKQFNAFQKLYF